MTCLCAAHIMTSVNTQAVTALINASHLTPDAGKWKSIVVISEVISNLNKDLRSFTVSAWKPGEVNARVINH